MRFIVMHKVDAYMEAGGPAIPEIVENMTKLVRESLKDGAFENGAGLHRSALRVRVDFRGGQRTMTSGPYAGENELVAAVFLIRAASMDRAVEETSRVASSFGDVEIEVGPVVEPWDLGLVPKPASQPFERFLLLVKGGARTEAGADAELRAAFAEASSHLRDADALLLAELLAPSARGARLASSPSGKRGWVDGPFTESKELIAGFSIVNLPSREAVRAWADRYAAILAGNEVDVRELATR